MLNICIQNLGKYNEGQLLFKWVELPVSEEELAEAYDSIKVCHDGVEYTDCFGSPYEEVMIADYESDIEGLEVGEWSNIEELNELVEELEGADAEIISAYIEATGCGLREALDNVDNCTFYEGYTLLEVAYEIVEQCYELSEFAERYFDYEAFARDLGYDGYEEVSNGVICTY